MLSYQSFRTGSWAGGLLLLASVTFAQTPPATQPTPSQTPPASPSTPGTEPKTTTDQRTDYQGSGSPITVTGCVQRADATSSSTGAGGFVLKPSRSASSSSSTSTTSPSSSSSSATSSMGQEYQLMAGSSGVSLADHVGHMVEVRGTVAAGATPGSSASSPSSADPTRPGSTQPGQSTSSATPAAGLSLNVTSVRMISSSCTQ
jgi:hypothetical protein